MAHGIVKVKQTAALLTGKIIPLFNHGQNPLRLHGPFGRCAIATLQPSFFLVLEHQSRPQVDLPLLPTLEQCVRLIGIACGNECQLGAVRLIGLLDNAVISRHVATREAQHLPDVCRQQRVALCRWEAGHQSANLARFPNRGLFGRRCKVICNRCPQFLAIL